MGLFNRKKQDSSRRPASAAEPKQPRGVVKINTIGLPDETGKVTYYSQDGDQYESPNVGFTRDGDIVSW